jgi:Cu-Zn family superoxide dismutase
MIRWSVSLAALLPLCLLPPYPALAQGPRVTAALVDSAGERRGEVTASEDAGGALLQVHARGLPPGRHGMHLHATPACDPPDFASAAGHFNPEGRRHGHRNPDGPHVGDLPNLLVGGDSAGRLQVRVDGYLLRAAPRSIGAPGVALVIHALPDDEVTDPSGASGARLACAVITVGTGP